MTVTTFARGLAHGGAGLGTCPRHSVRAQAHLARARAAQVARAEAKDIIFDQESRAGLQRGINKVADAVGVTLGPRGALARRRQPRPRGLPAAGTRARPKQVDTAGVMSLS